MGWVVVGVIGLGASALCLVRGLGGLPILVWAVLVAAIGSRARESHLTLAFAATVTLVFLGFAGTASETRYTMPIELPLAVAIESEGLLERAFLRANERAPHIGEGGIPTRRGFRVESVSPRELRLVYESGLHFGQCPIDKIHLLMLRDGIVAEWGGEPLFHGFGDAVE